MATKDKELNRKYQREFRARMTAERKKQFDKERYQRNKIKYNERSTQWALDNPHHAQASVHQTTVKKKYPEIYKETNIKTKELKTWLEQKRNTPCPYCGEPATHIDHIIPLSKGGTHTWDNIEIICKTCNFAKNDKTKEEFLVWIRGLLKNICKFL